MGAAGRLPHEAVLRKAVVRRAAQGVRRPFPHTWRVEGSERPWVVRLTRAGLRCTCPAGRFGRHCYHLAAVVLTLLPPEWRKGDGGA